MIKSLYSIDIIVFTFAKKVNCATFNKHLTKTALFLNRYIVPMKHYIIDSQLIHLILIFSLLSFGCNVEDECSLKYAIPDGYTKIKPDKSNYEILKLNYKNISQITVRCGTVDYDRENVLDDFTQLGMFVRMQISRTVDNLKAYDKTAVINKSFGDKLYNGQGFSHTSGEIEKYIQMGMIRVGEKCYEIHLECLLEERDKSIENLYEFIKNRIFVQ